MKKRIAVVAHDNCKKALLDFVDCNFEVLAKHTLLATGTTGRLVEELIKEKIADKGATDSTIDESS